MIEPGATGRASKLVEESDLASAYGNPEARVLATMVLATLLETAALKAIADGLDDDQICVGSRLDFFHQAPTPPGFTVTAQARLVQVDGRKLVFEVEASDEHGQVARGTHERFIVDKNKFQAMVATKAAKGPAGG